MTDLAKPSILDVAAAVIGQDDSVLVARRAEGQHLAGKWEFPGGKIEKDELPEECLRRELKEELGVMVAVGDYIGESVYHYPGKRVRLLAYHVKLLSLEIVLTVHDRIDWVKIGDLAAMDLAEADIPIALALQQQQLLQSNNSGDYYDLHFQEYSQNTFNLDPASFLSPFIKQLHEGSTVLDIGCGSGRDLLWLRNRGYQVTGFERSSGLAGLARRNSGCPVIEGDFTSHDFSHFEFDGLLLIGALIHLHPLEFPEVLDRISLGTKPGGKMYLTLKEGEGVVQREDGRVDTLWRSEELESIFSDQRFAVLAFSRDISVMGTGEVWLSYLLTCRGGC